MAGRIRTIKPEILSDSKAVRLSDTAWRLWVSSWLLADDAGRLPADETILAGQVFPGRDPREASRALDELSRLGFLAIYEVNDQRFAEIHAWARHQKIDRPSGAKFPAPCNGFVEPSRGLASPRRALDADHDHDPFSAAPHSAPFGLGSPLLSAALSHGQTPAPIQDAGVRTNARKGASKPQAPALAPEELAGAEVVLAKLSERTGRSYAATIGKGRRATKAAMLVARRLREGWTEMDLRLVVWDRGNEWGGDPKMDQYLRPSTLFAPEKIEERIVHARAAWEADELKRRRAEEPRDTEVSPLVLAAMGRGSR